MSHSMKLKVVAEGVEEIEQKDKLKEFGCDIAQGYYYSKPMPKDVYFEYIKNHLDIKDV